MQNFKIIKLQGYVKVIFETSPGESTSITYFMKIMHILSLVECNLSKLEIT